MGVVFGDIGTSPLYALREAFGGHHRLAIDSVHVMGVVSLIFWSMILVVTLKYVTVIMRADNKGEGGSLALLALVSHRAGARRWTRGIVLLGVFATALFYGDSMITPAVSVLAAAEGIAVAAPGAAGLVLPVSLAILVGLFLAQTRGASRASALFGPVMLAYFAAIGVLGLLSVLRSPGMLWSLSPSYAAAFFASDSRRAFLALGSVVLAVTGAEALYSTMGLVGRRPIRLSWMLVVLPALMLNYLGQGALLLRDGAGALRSPFFLLAAPGLRLPLAGLAVVAAVIASQAVVTGAFTVTQQAIQLGFVPRLRIEHTSARTAGRIFIPLVNWMLMVVAVLLVLFFRTSSALTSAYGVAVTGAMTIDTCLLAAAVLWLWRWPRSYAAPLLALLFLVDGAFLLASLTKVRTGGWFPLLAGVVIFTVLTTWSTGRRLMIARLREAAMPIKVFIQSAATSASRVPGTAVFMTSSPEGVPHALLHNLKHNRVLHERVVLLTVKIADTPYAPEADRFAHEDLGAGFHRVVLRFGFMEEPDVPASLKRLRECGAEFRMMDTSFFLSRQTLLAAEEPGMMIWRERLFAWLLRNAESAMEFFRLPTNRVVELGSQVEI